MSKTIGDIKIPFPREYRLYASIGMIITYYLLRVSYEGVNQLYGYMGFQYEIDTNRSIYSNLLFWCILLYWSSRRKMNSFDWSMSGFIFLILTLPMLVYFEFNPDTNIYYFLGHLSFLLIYFIIALNSRHLKVVKIERKYNTFVMLFIAFIMVLPIIQAYGFNFNFNVFLLEDIYDVRLSAREKSNFLTGYFYPWLSRVVAPIGLIYGLLNRKWVLFSFCLVILLYLFLCFAQKSVLFRIFLMFIFYFISTYEKKLLYFQGLLVILLLTGFVLDSYGINLIRSLVLYRFLFVPIEVGAHFYDFFVGQHTYWSQTAFNVFMDYPYELTPPRLIGIKAYGNPNMSANTGIVADGYMNMGFMGTLVNVILTSVLFSIVGRVRLNHKYFGVIFLFIIGIQNSALSTILLTHGLAIFILVVLFVNLNPLKKV